MEKDERERNHWHKLPYILAEKLPNDKQEEIFNIHNIDKLTNSILFPLRKDFDYDEDDSRRTRLAAILAKKGIRKCISQYSKITRPQLSEDLITSLRKSISKCNDIALQIELRKVESRNVKSRYLFDWNKVRGSDGDNELKEFLKDEYNQDWVEDAQIERSPDSKTIYINPTTTNNSNSISIRLADDKTNATLLIFDADGNEILNRKLIVKDNDGKTSIYYKRNKIGRKKRENNENTRPPAFFTDDY